MKKDKNALGAHDQTTCHWSFYIFQSFFPSSELQDCRSVYKITNSFKRSQIHFQDCKFISKIANSFQRLKIHFQDCKFIYKIKIHLYDRKFLYKITMHKQNRKCVFKIANAFVNVQMLL